jgi:hypothetical protein
LSIFVRPGWEHGERIPGVTPSNKAGDMETDLECRT